MAPQSKPHTLRTILGFAAITAAAGITLGWPQPTHAERNELSMWVAPGTQVAPSIVAEGGLVRDAKAKSGWAIEIRARNASDRAQPCDLIALVSEVEGIPLARVTPPPKTVWETRQRFSVPPHAEVARRIPVSAALALKLDRESPPRTAKGHGDSKQAPEPKVAQQLAPPPPASASSNRVPPRFPAPLTFSSLSVRIRPAG
jgi:hypothetical protein